MNWFKSLTSEGKSFIATSLALILVLAVGIFGYKYVTENNAEDCTTLTAELEELKTQFNASKENAETVIANLESAPYAEGFTTFSIGKHGIEDIQRSISQFKTPEKGCGSAADQREFKNLIEANTRVITTLDNQVGDLQESLKNHQVRTLTTSINTKVEQLRGAKISLTAAMERGKQQTAYAATPGGVRNLGQAEAAIAELGKKIESYTAETDNLETLAQRITQLDGETEVINNAKNLAALIDKEMVNYVRVPGIAVEDKEAEEKAKQEAEEKKAQEEAKRKAEEAAANQVDKDILVYGYDCSGDTYEYRASKGWDVEAAKADAHAKCKSVKLP